MTKNNRVKTKTGEPTRSSLVQNLNGRKTNISTPSYKQKTDKTMFYKVEYWVLKISSIIIDIVSVTATILRWARNDRKSILSLL